MPYPIGSNASEEEVDYGGEEDLDIAEDDGLFYSDESPMHVLDLDTASEKNDNDILMEDNDVAEIQLSPTKQTVVFKKRDNKTGGVDSEDEEELLKEILEKGSKYFDEHNVIDAKITKTKVAIRMEPMPNDGEGGGEEMDISNDSGHFEELDENGSEILGIEKDLQDIEAQHEAYSESAEKALATLEVELTGLSKHQGAKSDPKDGPAVSCEMEIDRKISPFGHVNFYPNDHKLRAGFSDHADADHRSKKVSMADEAISPRSSSKFEVKRFETALEEMTPPSKSHEMPSVMPLQFPGNLASPPRTDVDIDARRNAIGVDSYASPPLSPNPIVKTEIFEETKDAKDTKGYLIGEKRPWSKESELDLLPEEIQDIKATPLLDQVKKALLFKQGATGSHELDLLPKKINATSSWPPWMTAEEIYSLEKKGVDALSIASLQKMWESNASIEVYMFSLPQGGLSGAAYYVPSLGMSQAPNTGSSQFGYETSNDPPKQRNTEKDKSIREYVTTHQFLAHRVNSTIAPQPTLQTTRAITLVRPARLKRLQFEQPFELARLLEHVRKLYPVQPMTPEGRYDHLSFRLIRVSSGDGGRLTGFNDIASLSDAFLNGGALQDHYQNEILPRLMAITDKEEVWVVRTFTRLWVQDGRDTSNFFKLDLVFPLPQVTLRPDPDYFFAQYDMTPDPPGCIKAQFGTGITALMGRDASDTARVQVDRHKKEWLMWDSNMDNHAFLIDLLWRIDDPTINVYPTDWNPLQSFEESEEERETRRKRRAQAAEDALNAARLMNSPLGLRIPIQNRQDPLISSQVTQRLSGPESLGLAERAQDLNRREQLLAQWAAQLQTRDTQLEERTATLERTIAALEQQRQTLNVAQQTFERANNQAAERTLSLNIQHEALQNVGTCTLNDGTGRCGRLVIGENTGDLYGSILRHVREYHMPRAPEAPEPSQCRLDAICHADMDLMSGSDQMDHILMHTLGGRAKTPPTGLGDANSGPQNTGPQDLGRQNTRLPTVTPTASSASTPTAVVPSGSNPAAAQPAATKPAATKPAATKPAATKPRATKPAATKPRATRPAATKPAATKPAATKPNATTPTATKPAATKSAATKPAATQPAALVPTPIVPTATNTAATIPATIIPTAATTIPATVIPAAAVPAAIIPTAANPAATIPAAIVPVVANQGIGITPHPSGNPVGGLVGLDAQGRDPQSDLMPRAKGTVWICRCGTNLNAVKNNDQSRARHYVKCGYNDAHLKFRGAKDKLPEEFAKAAGSPRTGTKRDHQTSTGISTGTSTAHPNIPTYYTSSSSSSSDSSSLGVGPSTKKARRK
ncbi:hypothetical protein MMC26_001265 [Xylographa opegraphella]|nr:hypothetical protein [Xylographa opegraphella]